MPRDQLEEESQCLSTQRRLLDINGDDEALVSSEDEDELSDDLGSECYEPSLMDCDNDGRNCDVASGRERLKDPVSITQDGEEVDEEAEMVSEIMQE